MPLRPLLLSLIYLLGISDKKGSKIIFSFSILILVRCRPHLRHHWILRRWSDQLKIRWQSATDSAALLSQDCPYGTLCRSCYVHLPKFILIQSWAENGTVQQSALSLSLAHWWPFPALTAGVIVITIIIRHPSAGVMAVQGHPRSLISVPIESVYATSYRSSIVTLVLSCPVSENCRFSADNSDLTPIPPKICGVSLELHCVQKKTPTHVFFYNSLENV